MGSTTDGGDVAGGGAGGIFSAGAARAADVGAEAALQRTLDQPFDLKLQKVELGEAFKQIAEKANIALQVDPACYNALPYGASTKVSADFRQSKLRDAIEEVLIPLGLQQTVSGATVIVRPSDPLARIGRKAEWEELKLLQELRTVELKTPPTNGFDWTDMLRNATGRPGLVVTVANTDDPTVHDKAVEQLRKQFPVTAFRAIEAYSELTRQIWFVETGVGVAANSATVRIMPMKRWIYRQMERPVQISFTNTPLEKVVAELNHLSGIRIAPEPGLFQAIPVVSLNSNNGSVIQTLETLAGATGIAFDVREDSVLLHIAGKQAVVVAPRMDTIVGRYTLPVGKEGNSVEVFIRESDLPVELNELRKKKLKEALEGMQKVWRQEGAGAGPGPMTGPAATQATTMPATSTTREVGGM